MSTENKITVAIRKADRAAGTMLNACKSVAEVIMASENWDKSQPKAEASRLLSEAKTVTKADGYEVKNRNVWMFVSQYLVLGMVGEDTLLTVKDDGTATVRKRAKDLKTAREIAAGAKAARQELGISDGRASNGANERKTSKPKPAQPSETVGTSAALGVVRQMMETKAGKARLVNFFKSLGYELKPTK